MRYGSVCSGIEAASVAWRPLGWECAFVSEIEKFPAAVLAERFPEVPNLGDFTKIARGNYEGDIDLLVGGTPCQAFSIAGLRKGLNDERGNLALEFARLAFRTHARWVVWENVPGVLSSKRGEDFATFLSLLVGWEVTVPNGKWRKAGLVTAAPGCFNVGWRVLDAQYTRVQQFPRAIPQRRRRVILVGSLGSWEDCAKVLFDGEMCGGDAPPRREARQAAPGDARKSAKGAGWRFSWWDGGQRASTLTTRSIGQMMPDKDQLPCVIDTRWHTYADDGSCPSLLATDYKEPKAVCDPCPTLDASYPGKQNNQDVTKLVCYENHGQDSRIRDCGEVAPSIPAQAANNNPLVVAPADVFGQVAHAVNKNGDGEKYAKIEVAETRNTFSNSEARTQEVVVQPKGEVVAIDMDKNKPTNADKPVRKGGAGFGVSEKGASYTLTARDQHAVAYAIDSMGSNAMKSKNPHSGSREIDVATTLDTTNPTPSKNQGGMAIVEEAVAIAENVIGRKVENGGNGVGAKEGVCYTLDTVGVHGVCYPIDMMNVDGRGDNFKAKCYGKPGSAAYALTRRRPSGVCLPEIGRAHV